MYFKLAESDEARIPARVALGRGSAVYAQLQDPLHVVSALIYCRFHLPAALASEAIRF